MGREKKRVLIVDDEEDLTWSISKGLAKDRDSLEVVCVNSGMGALDVLSRSRVDLMVTDFRMPGVNGLQLLNEIKVRYPQTKVIVMTAYGSMEIKEALERSGTTGYIEKPFDINDLRELIHTYLEDNVGGFEGHLANVHLLDLLFLLWRSKNTLALEIFRQDEEGIIYFDGGNLVHAECGDKQGEDALESMLRWQEGSFKCRFGKTTSSGGTVKDGYDWLVKKSMG